MRKESVERVARAIFKGIRGRQRLYVPLVGIAMAVSCSNLIPDLASTSSNEPVPIVVPAQVDRPFPPTVVDSSAFNFCEPVTLASGPVERKMAGLPVAKEEVLEVSKAPPKIENIPDDVDSLEIAKTNIIAPKNKSQDKLQILLIPSEYSRADLSYRMEHIRSGLEYAYKGVNIQFSYLNFSTGFDINRINQYPEISDYTRSRFSRIMDEARKASVIDEGVIITNTSTHLGSCCRPAISSGESRSSIAVTSHETAHILDLYDGHKQRSYKREQLNNEQLALSPEALFPAVGRVYRLVEPTMFVVGSCNGEPVYTMDTPERNIMISYTPTNAEILARKGEYIFNSVQRAVINNKIEELIKLRPKTN